MAVFRQIRPFSFTPLHGALPFQERYGTIDASRQSSHSTIPSPTAFERRTDTPGLPATMMTCHRVLISGLCADQNPPRRCCASEWVASR